MSAAMPRVFIDYDMDLWMDGAVAQDLWEPEARQVLAHPCPKHTHTEEDQ